MSKKDKNQLIMIIIICLIFLLMGSIYIFTSPNAENDVMKITDYPVTPDENMNVTHYDDLTKESQQAFIESYTEDKYVLSGEIKDIDIIQYNGNYYQISYTEQFTESGFIMGAIAFFSFMLLFVAIPALSTHRQ